MPICHAIVLTGERAGRYCNNNCVGTRCGKHDRSVFLNPVGTAHKEINAYIKGLQVRAERVYPNREQYLDFIHRVNVWRSDRVAFVHEMQPAWVDVAQWSFPYGPAVPEMFHVVYNAVDVAVVEVMDVNAEGEVEVVHVPVPPEAPANPIPAPRRRGGRIARAARRARAAQPVDIEAIRAEAEAAVDARPLAAFAADKQNVHTTQSVDITKTVVERVLKIAVPEEYRWNLANVSKTAGEIITECKLTAEEMVEMLNRYIRDDDVYEMGKGIYGKVLDGVWQYIRNSPDKADMCRILKQELKDNIGMCAQGNLTRLCNVLAGYMDGIGPQETVSERLGRELPLLMDDKDRVTKAKTLMKSLNVPEAEWAPWLEALA